MSNSDTETAGRLGKRLSRRFRKVHLTLVIVVFLLAGLFLLLSPRLFEPTSWVEALVTSLGISVVAFALTATFFTVLTNQMFEDKVTDRIDEHLKMHVGQVSERTSSFLNQLQVDIGHLTERLENFVPLFGNCDRLGLVNIYLTRTDALADFSDVLTNTLHEASQTITEGQLRQAEIASADRGPRLGHSPATRPPRLWFVSSSMNGFLSAAFHSFDGAKFIESAADLAAAGHLDLRILMTKPDRGDERATQEDRAIGDIPREILANVNLLRSKNVKQDMVRFVRSTPTVFAIATDDLMLLNPYPHSQEAFRSFCMTVRRTPNVSSRATAEDIYRQYEQHHFESPWSNAEKVPDDVWNAADQRSRTTAHDLT